MGKNYKMMISYIKPGDGRKNKDKMFIYSIL